MVCNKQSHYFSARILTRVAHFDHFLSSFLVYVVGQMIQTTADILLGLRLRREARRAGARPTLDFLVAGAHVHVTRPPRILTQPFLAMMPT